MHNLCDFCGICVRLFIGREWTRNGGRTLSLQSAAGGRICDAGNRAFKNYKYYRRYYKYYRRYYKYCKKCYVYCRTSYNKNIVAAESTFDSNYILHFILYHYVWNLELLLGRFAVEGFIEEVTAENLDGFGVIVCERLDVADALLLEDFFEGD